MAFYMHVLKNGNIGLEGRDIIRFLETHFSAEFVPIDILTDK